MPTQVCITIDTEFSIGGAFGDPVNRRPLGPENVTCPVGSDEHGLRFLLETFAAHGVSATFFVETTQSTYFGDDPMRRLVERILEARQDVQLHVHPCWRTFRDPQWGASVSADSPPNDNCDQLAETELSELIDEGLATLRRYGVAAPVAMRTGNLRASRGVYRAMAACGLRLASNVGVGLIRPADDSLVLRGGRHWIEGVLEVPVLTYTQLEVGARSYDRLLTTTATSAAEMQALLWQARACDVPTVVILTHPFEFIKGERANPASHRVNRVNQSRLQQTCQFIADNPSDFEAVSFASAAPGWLEGAPVADPDLKAPLLSVLARMAENKANDLIPAI
ncbi:MAG TPA: hypothetical protein VEZ48_10065 [Sphingomonadaceae bacterium]|nr:hypothetical protein [Sphingomonadaceae bacterium]